MYKARDNGGAVMTMHKIIRIHAMDPDNDLLDQPDIHFDDCLPFLTSLTHL
jgi:hypothetical protein